MGKFVDNLKSELYRLKDEELKEEFLKGGLKPVSVDFKMDVDYMNEVKLNYQDKTLATIHGGWTFNTEHKLKKEFTAQLWLHDNNNIIAAIKDKETNSNVVYRSYTPEEFASTDSPLYDIDKKGTYNTLKERDKAFVKEIKDAVKRGSLKVLPEQHEQSFLLQRLIRDTHVFAELKEKDISTTALFKKELNNFAKLHIDSDLYPQQFTKSLDIPDTVIDIMIDKSYRNINCEELVLKCVDLEKGDLKGVLKYNVNLGNAETGIDKTANIKMKLGKEGYETVIKMVAGDKQFTFGTDLLENSNDRLNLVDSLNLTITEAANEANAIIYQPNAFINQIKNIKPCLSNACKGIDKDLPFETVKEKVLQGIDNKAQELGLSDHKALLGVFYGTSNIEDKHVDTLINQVATNHVNKIDVDELAPVYSHLNDNELKSLVVDFTGLSKLPRSTTQKILKDLKTGDFSKQAKSYQRVNGDFHENLCDKNEEQFLRLYVESKVSSKEELNNLDKYDLSRSLAQYREHNKHIQKSVVKNRVLEF